jgi:hypothetical protein
MDEPIDVQFSNFHCCAEWHLARLSPICALIYGFGLRISKKSGRFTCSAASVAQFLGVSIRTVQRGFQELKSAGFFRMLESGKHSFEPSVYHVLTHLEWAKQNPGRCVEKAEFPWTNECDRLGQALWVASGSRIAFKPFQVNVIRNTGIPEPEIISLFESWYPRHKADKWGKKWRNSVAFHFITFLREQTETSVPAATEEVTHHA